MPNFGDQCRRYNLAENLCIESVFPYVPARLVLIVDSQIQINRGTHCEYDGRPIVRDLDIANCAEALSHGAGDISGQRTWRSTILEIEIGAEIETDQFSRIYLYELALVVDRQWCLDVRNREIYNDGIRRLAVTELYALVSAIAGCYRECY